MLTGQTATCRLLNCCIKMKRRYAGLITLYILVVLISVFAGNRAASAADILRVLAGDGTSSHGIILFQVRLPRIIAASGCGAALAAAGFLLQGSLDNRIASPGILGINNGAGLFVLISAWFFPFRPEIKCVMAFFGALTVTLLISLLTIRTGMSKTSVILSGVAISALSVSLIDVIISIKPETVADRVAFQIGGFSTVNIRAVWFAIPLILTGLIASFLLAPSMDILALGDETAQGLGLNAKRCRYLLILCAALLSGASVSMS